MSGEMHVEVSGEGDFSMVTDSAWQVEVRRGADVVIVMSGDGGGIEVTAQRWNERGDERLGEENVDTAKLS